MGDIVTTKCPIRDCTRRSTHVDAESHAGSTHKPSYSTASTNRIVPRGIPRAHPTDARTPASKAQHHDAGGRHVGTNPRLGAQHERLSVRIKPDEEREEALRIGNCLSCAFVRRGRI